MRYSRIRRARNQRQYISLVIIIFLILGGIYFFTAGTMGKYISGIIAPILKSKQETDQLDQKEPSYNEDMELTLPDSNGQDDSQAANNQEEDASKTTETVKVNAMNFFGIQMGAFNSKENAQAVGDQLKAKGGAGYILDDQYSRVIAMMFLNENDAATVIQQLKNNSIEAQMYELKCPGVEMEITATGTKIEGIKSIFSLIQEKFGDIENTIKDLDNDKITIEIAINRLDQIKNEIIDKIELLNQYSATQEGNKVLSGLKNFLTVQVDNLDQIIQGSMSEKVAISSKIKYTYIDMIVKYKEYMEQIT
ncbi:MAG: SPOR domain-containing protein, partial [Thermoanaerobacteraceae bacterium]|nr:SPOR domain-containing protein [Thermoanaerobacteraceae bacterium]